LDPVWVARKPVNDQFHPTAEEQFNDQELTSYWNRVGSAALRMEYVSKANFKALAKFQKDPRTNPDDDAFNGKYFISKLVISGCTLSRSFKLMVYL
jgi:hypothetical protein